MKILECSSIGDKRFSSFCAFVNLNGIYDSIENHYQNSKGFNIKPETIKGSKPDYIQLIGIKYNLKYLTPLYNLLWIKYLDKNKELVEYASDFDDFKDVFKWSSINCQADTIRQYVKQGRNSFFENEDMKEFVSLLKSDSIFITKY